MAFYLLLATAIALPLVLLGVIAVGAGRLFRRLATLSRAEFYFKPETAKPGQEVEVHAHVVARGKLKPVVRATLTCTMFDHRARTLLAKQVVMSPIDASGGGAYVARLKVPDHALRTGVVGDQLSALFSEEAHRLLVSWTIVFEVLSPDGVVLARRARPLQVPEGQPLKPEKAFMKHLVVDTMAALHDDLLLNWLVQLAAHDGEIAPQERELLHDVLRSAHGIDDPLAADTRIAAEEKKKVSIEPDLFRKHVPREKRIAFYQTLYALAWRDGVVHQRELEFLEETLRRFGLDRAHAREAELSVLREAALSDLAEAADRLGAVSGGAS
jgi:uncharacterized tellurite resistance protein B-like protein